MSSHLSPQHAVLDPSVETTIQLVLHVQRTLAALVDRDLAAGKTIPRAPTLDWVWWRILDLWQGRPYTHGAWEGHLDDLVQHCGLSERTIRSSLRVLHDWNWLSYRSRGRSGVRIALGPRPE